VSDIHISLDDNMEHPQFSWYNTRIDRGISW